MRDPIILTDGWQVARRSGGWFLQWRTLDDTWVDVSGPYTQRVAAVRKWQRMQPTPAR